MRTNISHPQEQDFSVRTSGEVSKKYSNQYEARFAIIESRRSSRIIMCFGIVIFLVASSSILLLLFHSSSFQSKTAPYFWHTVKREGWACKNTMQGQRYIADEKG